MRVLVPRERAQEVASWPSVSPASSCGRSVRDGGGGGVGGVGGVSQHHISLPQSLRFDPESQVKTAYPAAEAGGPASPVTAPAAPRPRGK